MELRQLRYFVTLAETLHFRRAADRLHISQPTLSHQIKALENQVGTALFERGAHQVQLTASGKIFREHAQRAVKEIEVAANEIGELDGLLRGSLTIGVFQSFNNYMLPSLMREFYGSYPEVHVVVYQLPKREMEQRILSGELDLGIAYAPTISDSIDAEQLFDESYAFIVGRRHPLYRRTRIQISALGQHPLIGLTPEFPLRQVLDATFSRMRTKPRIIIEMNSNEAILETVRCTKLGTILASHQARSIRGLHCIELEPAIKRTAALFWRRGGHRSKAALVMSQLIKTAYGQRRGIPLTDAKWEIADRLEPS